MIDIKVEIVGLEKIKEGLKKAPQEMVIEVGKAVQKSTNVLWNQSLREAPVNKTTGGGNLRQNIRARMISKMSGIVEALAPYSIYVHAGTKPHIIVPIEKNALANRRTGEFFGKKVNHPGTQANPFFTRAIERSQGKVNEFFQEAIDKVLNTLK